MAATTQPRETHLDSTHRVVDEAVNARPNGRLGSVVAEHHAYRQRHVAPARHLGLPSPYLTVIFTVDDPLRITCHADPAQTPGDFDTLIGGLHTSPAVIEHDGAQSGIQLQVSPLGARALFGVPAGELASLDVDGAELLGPLAPELHERLRDAAGWPERFATLDRHLGLQLDDANSPPAEIVQAWRLLMASHGTARVADIARRVGWGERRLANRFRTEIGLTPKAAARVIRFDRARRQVGTRGGAEVAARCGYFDQSHLVRDFVAFTGLSPGAWLAAEAGNAVGNIQDSAGREDEELAS